MRAPKFVNKFLLGLSFEALCLFLILFLGPYGVMMLMLVAPLTICSALPDMWEWFRSEHGESKNPWQTFASLLVGSSLIFLLVTSGLNIWPQPEQGNIWQILGHFYLQIFMLRFYVAGQITLALLPLPLILSRCSLARFQSVATLLCTLGGVFLARKFLSPDMAAFLGANNDDGTLVLYILLAFYYIQSFCYALVWGGLVHWFVRSVSRK